MIRTYWVGLVVLVCWLLLPSETMAAEGAGQYNVTEEAYRQFKNAYDNYTDKRLLSVSDSLTVMYSEHHDPNYLLLSYVLQHIYYSYQSDERNFENAVRRGKQLALDLGHQDDYYLFCANEINFNMYATRRQFLALQQAKSLMAKAEESNNPVAMYLSTYALATAYHLRQNWSKAYECFERAADIILNFRLNDRKESLSLIYMMMGVCQLNMGHNELALECAEKSKQVGDYGSSDADFIRLSVFFLENKPKEFFEALVEVRKYIEEGVPVDPDFTVYVDHYEAVMLQNYPIALQIAQRFSDPYNQMEAEEVVYFRMKDYKRAFEISKRIREYKDSINLMMDAADIDEINANLRTAELEKQNLLMRTRYSQAIYAGIILAMALSLAYVLIHSINRKKTLRKLAKSHHELLVAQENERKAKASTESALRRVEEALARAELADKIKREFISNVSHEIRTPMNAISGFTQLLLDPDWNMENEDKGMYNQQIQENISKLNQLINNILEISSLDTGVSSVDKRLLNCNAMLEECQSVYAEAKQINLELVPGKSVFVHSDANRLKSVLQKLIDNTIKFAYDEPVTMGISLEENPGKVTIFIADHGPGIPASMEFTIFERFKKLDEFTPGLGLGLSIAKAQAESIGGQLRLDTSYTGGCRFVLVLPKN